MCLSRLHPGPGIGGSNLTARGRSLTDMRNYLLPFVVLLLLSACGASKKRADRTEDLHVRVTATPADTVDAKEVPEATPPVTDSRAEAVIQSALQYAGVRYKYGGTTQRGMDCSGLLYVSFLENELPLPRTSHLMAREGESVRVSEIRKGDLLFFKTKRGGKKINHAGLVVEVAGDEVKFIHATTSRGVIISSLREGYWNHSFVKAVRVF